jgi:class 3 adenylate cyclase
MTEREQLAQAIAALEAQRTILGDAVVEAALGPMRRQLAELEQADHLPAHAFEGERKLVTVMFADISGYTSLAEKMDPEAVRELMNSCFNCEDILADGDLVAIRARMVETHKGEFMGIPRWFIIEQERGH